MDNWSEEWPTEPGSYWFYGIRCEGDVARQHWEDGEKPQFFRKG